MVVAGLGWAVLSVAAMAATYTSQIGTDGGTPFEITCPAGQVLVGIDYKSENYLVALAGFCKKVGPDGKVTGKLYGTDGYAGDVTRLTNPREPIYCRQDMVVDRLAVTIDIQHLVRVIQLHCGPSTGTNSGIYVGTTKLNKQAPDQVEYGRETEECRFGVGFVGAATRTGALQRLGLKCEPIGDKPNRPPLQINNGDTGDDGDEGGRPPLEVDNDQ